MLPEPAVWAVVAAADKITDKHRSSIRRLVNRDAQEVAVADKLLNPFSSGPETRLEPYAMCVPTCIVKPPVRSVQCCAMQTSPLLTRLFVFRNDNDVIMVDGNFIQAPAVHCQGLSHGW